MTGPFGVKSLGTRALYIGNIFTVVGGLFAAYEYWRDSDLRHFEQEQKAWAVLASVQNGAHSNIGQIHAVAFLVNQSVPLNGVLLKGKELGGVKAPNGSFSGSRIIESNLTGANLEEADFRHADLSGTSMVAARLQRAHFEDATLSDTDLSGAYLAGASFDKKGDGEPAKLKSPYFMKDSPPHDMPKFLAEHILECEPERDAKGDFHYDDAHQVIRTCKFYDLNRRSH